MAKNRKMAITIISVVLGCTALAVLTALVVFISLTNTYANQLENLYKRSLYELSSNVNDLEIDMSKLIATNDTGSKREVLNNIYNTCNVANSNISNLPIAHEKIDSVNKFINTLGGYCYSLLDKVNNDQNFTTEEYNTIESLHGNSVMMKIELNRYISNLKFDYQILSQVKLNNSSASIFDGGLSNVQSSVSKLPTLIYDGPFSESVINKEVKGLPENEVSVEEAKTVIKNSLKNYGVKSINYVNETNGKFVTYNFNVKLEKQNLYVQVTKRGGVLLNITSFESTKGNKLTSEQSVALAEDFAKELGFNNMYSVWEATNGNIVYVNLAPIVDGVIYYPDLIKVKVDKGNGTILGWEATNYCYNHVTRKAQAANISIAEAQNKLSKALTVVERNVCIIANKYVGESMAYEFICEWNDYTYYVYLDCFNGNELNILRVVSTTSGNLVM